MERVIEVEDVGISNARSRLTRLPEEVSGKNSVMRITSNRQPVLALLSWELFDAMVETLELLADTELMAMLAKSEDEIQKGKTISWEDAKAELAK
ncbi:MAG TPA: type II toxin-antitoxin system Phd/YefM family antitoxin [Caldisericia bacterium]|nr:type II toxin-antitoxin system Phd/YefM family antitoxin [Caldisericia bacterium]HQG60418.1 type II toxin-antitoxin system Phd/YefM family antitoxin [Caldisericia bacterium]